MNCPVCAAALIERAEGLLEDILIYECASCRAALYPAGALDRLDDNIVVNAEELEQEPIERDAPPLACPRCHVVQGYRGSRGVQMARRGLLADPTAELAVCPRCAAIWLTHGALEKVRSVVLDVSSKENAALNREAEERKRDEERAAEAD